MGADRKVGDVLAVAGEVVRVDIDVSSVGPTFDAVVRVDATVTPDLDLAGSFVMVVSAEDPSSGFAASATRVADAPAGTWAVVLDELPEGFWHVALGERPGMIWEPSSVTVSPGGGVPVVKLVSLGPSVAVRVTARDSVTGAELSGLEAMHTVDGMTFTYMNPAAGGKLMSAFVPKNRASTFTLRAPGYRTQVREHVPERDGLELVFELEQGWANRVVVLGSEDMRPAPNIGVLVDGEEVGRTDAQGVVWLHGEALPEKVDLATDGGSIEILIRPSDIEPETADPLSGLMFAVRSR